MLLLLIISLSLVSMLLSLPLVELLLSLASLYGPTVAVAKSLTSSIVAKSCKPQSRPLSTKGRRFLKGLLPNIILGAILVV